MQKVDLTSDARTALSREIESGRRASSTTAMKRLKKFPAESLCWCIDIPFSRLLMALSSSACLLSLTLSNSSMKALETMMRWYGRLALQCRASL